MTISHTAPSAPSAVPPPPPPRQTRREEFLADLAALAVSVDGRREVHGWSRAALAERHRAGTRTVALWLADLESAGLIERRSVGNRSQPSVILVKQAA